jgi:hypothetical protein
MEPKTTPAMTARLLLEKKLNDIKHQGNEYYRGLREGYQLGVDLLIRAEKGEKVDKNDELEKQKKADEEAKAKDKK